MKLSKDESRAIAFVLGLVALAAVARLMGRPRGTDLAPAAEVDAAALESKSEKALQRERAASRPLGKDERIDVNGATVEELDRLPGVGPGLAAKIVAERERAGAFDSAADLRAVPGFGRGLLARLEPHLEFGPGVALPRREHSTPEALPESRAATNRRGAGGARSRGAAGSLEEPRVAPSPHRPIAPSEPLDLNRATVSELEALPGIGPALAARIVARRDSAPFRSVEELVKVRGIGPATLVRLRGYFRS